MKTTPEQRKELREIEAKATKGPWYPTDYGASQVIQDENQYDGVDLLDSEVVGRAKDNCVFACAARNALPDLLDDLDATLTKLEAAEGQTNFWHKNYLACGDKIIELTQKLEAAEKRVGELEAGKLVENAAPDEEATKKGEEAVDYARNKVLAMIEELARDHKAYRDFMHENGYSSRLMCESGDYPEAYEVWFKALDEAATGLGGESVSAMCDGSDEIPTPKKAVYVLLGILSDALFDGGLKEHQFTVDGLTKITEELVAARTALSGGVQSREELIREKCAAAEALYKCKSCIDRVAQAINIPKPTDEDIENIPAFVEGEMDRLDAIRVEREKRIAVLEKLLSWLDRKGGLGLEVHELISRTLAEKAKVNNG